MARHSLADRVKWSLSAGGHPYPVRVGKHWECPRQCGFASTDLHAMADHIRYDCEARPDARDGNRNQR